ncbi:MAG: Glucose-6-phosphate isomerase [Chlamydiae bacterium]|nr:Glucose-6-phosphate isomerase [Chlamydiota bacterium]
MSFDQSASYKILEKFAKKPIDLTKNVLTKERIENYCLRSQGLNLFYATERVTDEVMDALFALAKEHNVVDKMHAMQNGKVINTIEGCTSENRSVLHTAMRDIFENRIEQDEPKNASDLAKEEMEKLQAFLPNVHDKKHLVMIGIGGSELGPKALFVAMEPYIQNGRSVHFVSNVDPDAIYSTFQKVELENTLVIVVSKSGSTLETLTNEAIARDIFEKGGLKPKEHFISVTGKNSPMDDPKQYLAIFYIWDYVGGRYSVTSMVGCVMLGFALGFKNMLEILKGANNIDKHVLNAPAEENLSLMSALLGIWNRNFLHHQTVAIIPYSKAMARFSAHLQQLDMESNGKHIDKTGNRVTFETGPIIWGEPGTNGQHSFYQLIHQGTTIVPMEFLGFKTSQLNQDLDVQGTTSQEKLLSNLFAQTIALAKGQKDENPNKTFEGNRPSRILFAKQLTPYTLGQILAFYEHKVAYQGFIWNINSFDQEGVQLGKILANKIIELFKAKRENRAPEESFEEAENYLKLIEKL